MKYSPPSQPAGSSPVTMVSRGWSPGTQAVPASVSAGGGGGGPPVGSPAGGAGGPHAAGHGWILALQGVVQEGVDALLRLVVGRGLHRALQDRVQGRGTGTATRLQRPLRQHGTRRRAALAGLDAPQPLGGALARVGL